MHTSPSLNLSPRFKTTNQDGEPLERADPSSCEPPLDPASITTDAGDQTSPLTVVAAPTAAENIINVDPEIPTTLINGKRQPNFRIPPRLPNSIAATINPTKSAKTVKSSSYTEYGSTQEGEYKSRCSSSPERDFREN